MPILLNCMALLYVLPEGREQWDFSVTEVRCTAELLKINLLGLTGKALKKETFQSQTLKQFLITQLMVNCCQRRLIDCMDCKGYSSTSLDSSYLLLFFLSQQVNLVDWL